MLAAVNPCEFHLGASSLPYGRYLLLYVLLQIGISR